MKQEVYTFFNKPHNFFHERHDCVVTIKSYDKALVEVKKLNCNWPERKPWVMLKCEEINYD